MNEVGVLRQVLDAAAAETGLPMKALTVLAPQNDAFRVDTPAGHRDGAWLANAVQEMALDRVIHLRGLHYACLGRTKPNGETYVNDEANWVWLQAKAAKAAKWLGYLPFDRIVDQRNAEPVVRVRSHEPPAPLIWTGMEVRIPRAEDLRPEVFLDGFESVQPYRLAIYGEKSSLEPVLRPLADQYGADLFLATGEISDTLVHTMAATAAEDGRPMVLLTFADCDPAGWQMPVSIARKLQAFKELLFPDLDVQVHRVGMLPDQVREYGLPSTPLKETEKRADDWLAATGVEQTELDALATLRPELLRGLAVEALDCWFDHDLDDRVREVRAQWKDAAQEALDAQMDEAGLVQVRAEAEAKLAGLRAEVDALNQALKIDASRFRLPPIPSVPDGTVRGAYGLPLFDSTGDYVEQTTRLIQSKAYADVRGGEGR